MNGQSSIGLNPPTLNGVNGVGMDVRDVVSILDNLTEENNPPGPNGLFRKKDENVEIKNKSINDLEMNLKWN